MSARYSVIIPALNEEKFLPKLVASLAEQTDKNFEVIVVDGSSKDRTVAVAKTFTKKLPKLTIIVSKVASLPLQRNIGAKAGKGEWFVFIDADSVVVPHFIHRIDEFIRTEKPGLFTTWLRPDSEKPGDANIALLGNLMFEVGLALHKPLPSGPLTAISRKAFTAVGGYDESQAFNEDVDICYRIAKAHFPIRIIPETLYTWSLRRIRHHGTARVIQQYILASLPILFFNRPLKKLPGYIMGGQLYNKKKKTIPSTAVRRFDRSLRKLLKDLFE
jgi:glycosyltransferase involved in cell wall biosynthesis